MDEPFGALDAFTREEMNRLVEEIWLDTRTTIVLITHSIDEAIFLSDRVVVMSPRPGRVANIHKVPFPRPRSLEIMSTKEVFDLTNAIKLEIVGTQQSRFPQGSAIAPAARQPSEDSVSETDAIPEFKAKSGGGGDVGITNMSALTSGPGIKSMREVLAIVLVAVIVIGGTELLLNIFAGAAICACPSRARSRMALVTEFPLDRPASRPHAGRTVRAASPSAPRSA